MQLNRHQLKAVREAMRIAIEDQLNFIDSHRNPNYPHSSSGKPEYIAGSKGIVRYAKARIARYRKILKEINQVLEKPT